MSNITSNLNWLPHYTLTTSPDDGYMLRRAYLYANQSPDPRTKNGAILVNSDGHIISCSANCFPRGVQKTQERLNDRDIKLAMIIHAELGAILDAAKWGKVTKNSTLYCPFYACSECSKAIIGADIRRVTGHAQLMAHAQNHEYWQQSIILGFEMMHEAGIELLLYDGNLGVLSRFNGENVAV